MEVVRRARAVAASEELPRGAKLPDASELLERRILLLWMARWGSTVRRGGTREPAQNECGRAKAHLGAQTRRQLAPYLGVVEVGLLMRPGVRRLRDAYGQRALSVVAVRVRIEPRKSE